MYINKKNFFTVPIAALMVLLMAIAILSCAETSNDGGGGIVCPTVSGTAPTKDVSNVYQIGDWKELQWITLNGPNSLAADYKLVADITFPDPGTCDFPVYGFVPIGYAETGSDVATYVGTPFSGTFDGNHKTISNFFIDNTVSTTSGEAWGDPDAIITGKTLYYQGYLGLFGRIDRTNITSPTVKNLTIKLHSPVGIKSNGSGNNGNVGVVAGSLQMGWLQNVNTRGGSLQSTANSNGGVVGSVESGGAILVGLSTVAVKGNNFNGGLVGYNAGIVVGWSTGAVSGNQNVGGLVGKNESGSKTVGWSTGLVTGNDSIGGLLGNNNANTTDIVGWTVSSVTLSNTGNTFGGLVGIGNGTGYWDLQASGLAALITTPGARYQASGVSLSKTGNIVRNTTDGTFKDANGNTAIFDDATFLQYFDVTGLTASRTWPKIKNTFTLGTTNINLTGFIQPTVSDTNNDGTIEVAY